MAQPDNRARLRAALEILGEMKLKTSELMAVLEMYRVVDNPETPDNILETQAGVAENIIRNEGGTLPAYGTDPTWPR